MSEYLPKEVRDGLANAQKQTLRRKSRMRVQAGDRTFVILRQWSDGFALDAEDAPHLRGLVDIYDGARHISQCLVVASEEDGQEIHFEYKRATPHADAPPLDYERDANAPVALIGRA